MLCALCMIIHIIGFLDTKEPLPHEMFFCGCFFGFFCISITGLIGNNKKKYITHFLALLKHTKNDYLGMCVGIEIPILLETIMMTCGAVFFILAAFLAMVHVEQDYHLMYLTDKEERLHGFFVISRIEVIHNKYSENL